VLREYLFVIGTTLAACQHLQAGQVERRVGVSKRLEFEQLREVEDDDVIILRNHGVQSQVSQL